MSQGRADLDPAPLLHLDSFFESDYPISRTLLDLVREDQRRTISSANTYLDILKRCSRHRHNDNRGPAAYAASPRPYLCARRHVADLGYVTRCQLVGAKRC
jgi:hypothetical protein